jgi:tellurite resistance protein TehA-like permease
MATGVAIAMHLHGVFVLPTILFWLNIVFFVGLTAATMARVLRYPRAFVADICSHSRGVGFFTAVAALGVFGEQLVLQMQAPSLAASFWVAALVLWPVVLYGMFAVLTVEPEKPSLADGLNGDWLTRIVATQSVSILTVLTLHSGVAADLQQPLMFAALALWLGGSAMYLWLIIITELTVRLYGIPEAVRPGRRGYPTGPFSKGLSPHPPRRVKQFIIHRHPPGVALRAPRAVDSLMLF